MNSVGSLTLIKQKKKKKRKIKGPKKCVEDKKI